MQFQFTVKVDTVRDGIGHNAHVLIDFPYLCGVSGCAVAHKDGKRVETRDWFRDNEPVDPRRAARLGTILALEKLIAYLRAEDHEEYLNRLQLHELRKEEK